MNEWIIKQQNDNFFHFDLNSIRMWLFLCLYSCYVKPLYTSESADTWCLVFQGVKCGQVLSVEPYEQPGSSPLSLNCRGIAPSKIWINVVCN